MNYNNFMKILDEVIKAEEPTEKDINNIIKKYIPLESISTNERTTNYFNHLVTHMLKTVDKSKLKTTLIKLDKAFANSYGSMKTLDSVLSKVVRKPIAEKYGKNSTYHKLSKSLVKISYEEKGKLIKDEENKKAEKNRNVTDVDVENVLEVIKNNIDNPDIYKQAIALLICCGSRPNEFFLHSTYSESPKEQYIIQKYLAKQGKDSEKASVEKPLIYIKPSIFIEKVKELKKKFNERYKNLKNAEGQLSSSVSTMASKVMKQLFPNDKTTFYNVRKYYGLVAHSLFSPNSNYNQFLQDVFLHKDANVSKAYSNFKVKEIKKDATVVQAVLENKIENIEDRLDLSTKGTLSKKVDVVENKLDKLKVPTVSLEVPLTKETKKRQQMLTVSKIYEDFKKHNNGAIPSQRKLEFLAKGKATREIVRSFYSQSQ